MPEMCVTEWRCPTWGCGFTIKLTRPACNSFGPAVAACPLCGSGVKWEQTYHGKLELPAEAEVGS
jgi:hypothetical protein